MKKLVLPFAGIVGGAMLLAGCLSAGPTPQDELIANSHSSIATFTKPGIDKLYEKVLNEEEREKLNNCVAIEMVKKLSAEELLYLGGNAQEKLSAKDALSTLQDKAKPTSKEMKESIKVCTVAVGLEKAIDSAEKSLNKKGKK